jgi:hypothetical protein
MAGIGLDQGSEHVAVGGEKRLELKIGWSEPCPLEVEERGDPGAVPDDVVQVGVAVDDCARGRDHEGIEMSEPLELLAELLDELLVDVLEVRCRLDESQRTVDGSGLRSAPMTSS